MRKRIRLEEFIFLRLAGRVLPLQQDVTAWYSRPGLPAHFSVPLNIYGGVGGCLKSLDVGDNETVLLFGYQSLESHNHIGLEYKVITLLNSPF